MSKPFELEGSDRPREVAENSSVQEQEIFYDGVSDCCPAYGAEVNKADLELETSEPPREMLELSEEVAGYVPPSAPETVGKTVTIPEERYAQLQADLVDAQTHIADLEAEIANLRAAHPTLPVEQLKPNEVAAEPPEATLPAFVGGLLESLQPAEVILHTHEAREDARTAEEVIRPLQNRGELDGTAESLAAPYIDAFKDEIRHRGTSVKKRGDVPTTDAGREKYMEHNTKLFSWSASDNQNPDGGSRHSTYRGTYLPPEERKEGAKDVEPICILTSDTLHRPDGTSVRHHVKLDFTDGTLQRVEHVRHNESWEPGNGITFTLTGNKPTIQVSKGIYGHDLLGSDGRDITVVAEYTYDANTNRYEPAAFNPTSQSLSALEGLRMLNEALTHIPQLKR